MWGCAAAATVPGAWAAPFFYNAGKALAEVTADKKTNGLIETAGRICRTAEFPAFFAFSLALAALAVFIPLRHWWGRGIPPVPLRPGKRDLLYSGVALTGGGLLFLSTGWWFSAAGFLAREVPGPGWGDISLRLPWRLAGGLGVEWFVRGVVFALCLRTMAPRPAILLCAVMSASAAMLVSVPGSGVPDPDASGVGFELLGSIGRRLSDPAVLAGDLLPLLALGIALGYARWRSGSLWLPVAAHAGWSLAGGLLAAFTVVPSGKGLLSRIVTGSVPGHGMIALAGALAIGVLVHFLIPPPDDVPQADV